MSIDANHFAEQVRLAYEFMDALHGQTLALIKDVERQLAESPEELRTLRPGGAYCFAVHPMSMSLENPQPTIVNYYAVCLRHFEGRIKNTPLDRDVPLIAFLKVVLRERHLKHPEARFGIITGVEKPEGRGDAWPKKFEDLIKHRVSELALAGDPPWSDQQNVTRPYQDSYITMMIRGHAVRLAELPDSEAIAERIVEPLLALYRQAAAES